MDAARDAEGIPKGMSQGMPKVILKMILGNFLYKRITFLGCLAVLFCNVILQWQMCDYSACCSRLVGD